MKNKVIAAIVAAVFAVLSITSALPVIALAESATRFPTPEGYNDHDYQKLVAFMEQTDEDGIKNGEKCSENYDPTDPETWGGHYGHDEGFNECYFENVQWQETDGELRVWIINLFDQYLCGALDVSGCTSLKELLCVCNELSSLDVNGCDTLKLLNCSSNNLTELDVNGCDMLKLLNCSSNNLIELNVSGCTALTRLDCDYNSLTELDVSSCTSLVSLYCESNNLTELDLSNNTLLESLCCHSNNLTELDLSNNDLLNCL